MMLREQPAGSEYLFAPAFHLVSPNEWFCSDKAFSHKGPTDLQYINIRAFKYFHQLTYTEKRILLEYVD